MYIYRMNAPRAGPIGVIAPPGTRSPGLCHSILESLEPRLGAPSAAVNTRNGRL